MKDLLSTQMEELKEEIIKELLSSLNEKTVVSVLIDTLGTSQHKLVNRVLNSIGWIDLN